MDIVFSQNSGLPRNLIEYMGVDVYILVKGQINDTLYTYSRKMKGRVISIKFQIMESLKSLYLQRIR